MKHTVTIINGGSLAAGFVHDWRAYLKKNGWLRRAAGAVLMVQLCLTGFSARADSANPAIAEKRATIAVNSVPEGYRLLPVTKFVVEVEKDAKYDISVAVECPGDRRLSLSSYIWVYENITGKIEIYRVKDNALISTHFVFNKKNDLSSVGYSWFYFKKYFNGESYGIRLDKGEYIISPHLFFKEKSASHVPLALVSFGVRHKLMK